jgi:hypothetical protein
VRHSLDAKYPFAFGIDLQRQLAAVQPEDRQIVRRFLDRHFPLSRFSFSGALPRPAPITENRLDRVPIQRRPAAVDERLQDLIHPTAQLQQQIPAVLDLVVGILIPKPTLLLLFQIQSEAQATGIDPTLTDLAQPPYRRFLGQGVCDFRQACGVSYMGKTVSLLCKADPGLLRLTSNVFMPITDDLGRKRRVAADLDGHVAPVGIQNMKRIEKNNDSRKAWVSYVPDDAASHSHSLPILALGLFSRGSEILPA